MPAILKLTGRHVRQVDALEEPDDPPDGEARTCRLAMLSRGENPANLARCRELLDMDLDDAYLDYIDPALAQMTSGETPIPTEDGDYQIPINAGETVVHVHRLRARDRRRLSNALASPDGDRELMRYMAKLDDAALDALTLGDYQAVLTAVDFLCRPIIERWSGKSSPTSE